ncbi:MAG: oligosaccharide flippase family protein, partial [Candidatus Korobacteraceae bacterium]
MANTAILAVYSVIETVVVFLFIVALARYLGVEEFGRIGFALSYALLTSVLSDPGISLGVMKLVARSSGREREDYVSNGLSLRAILGSMVFLGSLVPFAFSSYMQQSVSLLLCILVSEHLRNLALYFCYMFRAHQRTQFEVIALSVERFGCLALGWALLAAGYGALAIGAVYLLARGASLLLAVTMYLRNFHRVKFQWNRKIIREVNREFRPLSVVLLSDRLNTYLPPVLLTIFAGEYATGVFQAAFKTIMPAVLLAAAISGSLYPVMAARFVDSKGECARLYYSAIRTLLHLLLPSAVLLLVYPQEICILLFGHGYAESARVLLLLAPYCVAMAVIPASVILLPASDQQKIGGVLSGFSLLLNLSLGVVLIHYAG